MNKHLLASVVAIAALAAPQLATAASDLATPAGNAAASATANLDFRIVIPRVLYLRVGAEAATAVNELLFEPAAATLGNGTAVVGTGGDLGGGAVTVRVFGNGGTITLNSSVAGAMNNGTTTETIPWSQITVVSSALGATTPNYNNGGLTHPAFSTTTGAGTPVTLTGTNRVVREEARWTYSYNNTVLPAAGSYGGVNMKNGRVAYTASMP